MDIQRLTRQEITMSCNLTQDDSRVGNKNVKDTKIQQKSIHFPPAIFGEKEPCQIPALSLAIYLILDKYFTFQYIVPYLWNKYQQCPYCRLLQGLNGITHEKTLMRCLAPSKQYVGTPFSVSSLQQKVMRCTPICWIISELKTRAPCANPYKFALLFFLKSD